MEEPALCIGCNEATPRFRERKDPTRVFCGAECRKSFYAAPIGRGIFELLIVKPNLPTDIDYEIFMAAALNEASTTLESVPVHRRFEKLVRYLTKQLHELLAGPLPHIPQRLEKENAVLDLFFATANSQAVLAHFGVAQDRLKLDVFSMAMRGLSVQLAVRMSARYGVDPYNMTNSYNIMSSTAANLEAHNPFAALMSAVNRLSRNRAPGEVIDVRRRAASIAAHLAARPDFRSLPMMVSADVLRHCKTSLLYALLADARNLELATKLFAGEKAWPGATHCLEAAIYSGSIDMVRLIEPTIPRQLSDSVTPALIAMFTSEQAAAEFQRQVVELVLSNKERIVENNVLFDIFRLWKSIDHNLLLLMIMHSEPDEEVLGQALQDGCDVPILDAILAACKPPLQPEWIEPQMMEAIDEWTKQLYSAKDAGKFLSETRLEALRFLASRAKHRTLLAALLQPTYLYLLVFVARDSVTSLDKELAATANVELILAMLQANMLRNRWELNGGDVEFVARVGWTLSMMTKLAANGHVEQAFELLEGAQAWNPAFSPQEMVHRILGNNDFVHYGLFRELLRRYPIDVMTPTWKQWKNYRGSNPFLPMMLDYEKRVVREAAERRRAPEPGRGIDDDEDDDNDEDDNEEEKPKAPRLRSMIKV